MGWKVKKDGATLDIVMGYEEREGTKRALLRGVVGTTGMVINEPLEPSFEQRWEEGDEHARSLVDKLDDDGNVVGGEQSSEEAALAEADALRVENDTLKQRVEHLESQIEEGGEQEASAETQALQARVAELERQVQEKEESGDDSSEVVETLRARVAELEEALVSAGDGGEQPSEEAGSGDQYDPKEYSAEEVVEYLKTADDEEIARVKQLEESGKKRTTILNFEKEPAPNS